MPTFTFAIVNWNTRERLDGLLASIDAVRGDFDIQILVADNASSDGSAEMTAQKYPHVELVRNHSNLGFAGGHATLFPLSRGRYHVLVNSDVRLYPNCLEHIDARMTRDPMIGILGPQIIGPDDHIQPSCRRFPQLWNQLLDATGLNRLAPRNPWLNHWKMGDFNHTEPRQVDQVMGSLFVIRREVLDAIGMLDTRFFMYYEEVDFCLRAKQAGYVTFFEPAAQVWHEGGGSAKRVKVLTVRRTMRSMRAYFFKHRSPIVWPVLLLIVSLDMVTHILYAAATRNKPVQTFKAYGLALWDVARCQRADL